MNYSDFSGILKSEAFVLLAFLFINTLNFDHSNIDQVAPLTSANFHRNELPEYNRRPFYLFNQDIETIVPSVFFRSEPPKYKRERLELSDGDFLDLDWIKNKNERLIIISHGMEGDAYRHYVTRAVHYFSNKEWDVLAWNQLGCSGELNRMPRLPHHGSAAEIEQVINHVVGDYSEIVLIGFSMGGSQTLKYLSSSKVNPNIKGGIGFSVTFDFMDMMNQLELKKNSVYKKSFLEKLKLKIKAHSVQHDIDTTGLNGIRTFETFHETYGAILSGTKGVMEFYEHASPGEGVAELKRPMLIVNAQNDPLLGPGNYPQDEHSNFYFHYPAFGGHVGFTIPFTAKSYMEEAAEAFIDKIL